MAVQENTWNVANRMHSNKDSDNPALNHIITGADEIYDDDKNKKQSEINTETYSLVNDVNERLSGLSPDQQSALSVAAKATSNETKLGYYVCGTEGNVAAKVISDATGYILSTGGSIKVKMTNTNTADNATLNINSTGAKPLFYDGERASANNTWETGETVEVYYDGTNFYANNVAGGGGDGVFDVSEKYPTSGVEGGNTYTLQGALTVLNANLPASNKKGGMSIKFVQSSDNKYVQFRYMSSSTAVADFTNVANWQGVDDVPTADSNNLVKSGGVAQHLNELKQGNFTVQSGEQRITGYSDNTVAHIYAPGTGTSFLSSPYWSIVYYLATRDMYIRYRVVASSSYGNIVICDNLPVAGGNFTRISNGVVEATGYFSVKAGQYICTSFSGSPDSYLPELYEQLYETVNLPISVKSIESSANNSRLNVLAPTYFNGVRLVDTLTRQRYGRSTQTKIGNFTPVSATTDTITLSSEDAACIANIVILACKFSNGDYNFIYFSAASGTTITKLYDFGKNLDCQDIVLMQSLYDSVDGAQGIHLSPFGYRAMAHNLYEELQTKHPFSNVFVGGWSAQYCIGADNYLDNRIRNSNGDIVCKPTLSGISVGGSVNECSMVYKANTPNGGPYYRTYYGIRQDSPNGATVTFRINSLYQFKGFLRVNCSRYPDYNGSVNIIVKDFSGNVISTKSVAKFADSYVFTLDSKYYEGVDVVIEMPDNVTTGVKITEMTLHETYIENAQLRSIDNKSVVAMLGSSNTQFPGLSTAQELCPNDPDNEIVERPDGTEGDGCGYFGKELARVSGAVVDNWGKSGEQTSYGLDIIKKIFETKRYTHIILSLFANDANGGKPWKEIISNIRQMVEYAKGHGCIPIIVMGYGVNGNSMHYSLMYEDLTQGLDSPFIYTNSDTHI